ncbi:hypothetical protein PGT21_028299 [Puccinia graminis f. sp. tritici]|uniref:Uncharacterized protein n=1 Tax=Puccinia graminis f. sp. tritici TaxID=56615 RepID=A0A5B0MIE6_PUCGR|nr:hypothetical protein PGTUg99_021994 [Puccinia graminis f. sp. tritici]KAA1091201.1 hypothetical protein PGT21_028299 [Puccinia graminis f. sp. tritici]
MITDTISEYGCALCYLSGIDKPEKQLPALQNALRKIFVQRLSVFPNVRARERASPRTLP